VIELHTLPLRRGVKRIVVMGLEPRRERLRIDEVARLAGRRDRAAR